MLTKGTQDLKINYTPRIGQLIIVVDIAREPRHLHLILITFNVSHSFKHQL